MKEGVNSLYFLGFYLISDRYKFNDAAITLGSRSHKATFIFYL